MADHTKIEWADATVNAVNGCTRISPGCGQGGQGGCYAERLAGTRLRNHPSRAGLTEQTSKGPRWTGQVSLHEPALLQPLRWKRPRRIFWNAHGDLFHDAVPDAWIDRVFAVCALTPQHTHMILTKRSERMREYLSRPGVDARVGRAALCMVLEAKERNRASTIGRGVQIKASDINAGALVSWPLPNVWLGVSVEDQQRADERIPDLLATPAAVRFISAEPLLGPVRLSKGEDDPSSLHDWLTGHWQEVDGTPDGGVTQGRGAGLDWVIVGGESGPGARPMHPDWARSLRDQCAAAGVAFHFKQWGEWEAALDRDRDDPDWRADYSNEYVDRGNSKWLNLAGGCGFHGERFHVMRRVGKKAAGRLLDGVQHDGVPGHG